MNKESNIFLQLRDHAVTPPPDLLATILDNINQEKENELKALFGGLASYEVTPPSFAIPGTANKPVVRIKSLPFFKRAIYRVAAAILLLVAATWFIYTLLPSHRIKNGIAVIPVKNEAKQIETSTDTLATAFTHKADTLTKKNMPHQDIYFNKSHMTIGGIGFPLVDDDLLATFASFTYTEAPSFLKDTRSGNVLIQLDNYTSITISQSMRSMMKKMYQVRRNGKPTHMARKQKRKLAGWQNADIKYFDKKLNKNPLDILDLADFIFDK